MMAITTPEWANISALLYDGHVLVRRTRNDKNGRRYSYGPYYSAKHELWLRFSRFCSGELNWMKEQIEKHEKINQQPLIPGERYCGIGRIKYGGC